MKKTTILVVDNESSFRHLFSQCLSEDGYEVEAVSSGELAMSRIAQGEISTVVTDLVMSGMDGLEVLRQCRACKNPPEVILTTSHGTIETAVQALKNGAFDYLVKPFNPEELRHVVRTSLEQRRLLNENTQLKLQIDLFQRGQHLAALLDIEQLFTEALHALLHEVGGGRGMAFLPAENCVSQIIALNDLTENEALPLAHALLPTLKGLKDFRLLQGDELPTSLPLPAGTRSLCLLPLLYQNRLEGLLVLLNPEEEDFQQPLPLLNLLFLLEQIALGFSNASRYKDVRKLVHTDDLTGLHNYRYLQMIIDQEIHRAERYDLQFSLVFIDIDRFKTINDSHGHLAGSQALKEVAGLLRQSVREADILFRYGGDEFTGFLAETGTEGAAIVAERIRRNIEQHIFFAESDHPTRLTATVGYATFPIDSADHQGIIDLADRAMYVGKKVRNVVRSAQELNL
ncbi:MAG: diguanylate cyclase [Desulfuromonadaceae bacterium]|nr:diguanylate cyclase [Desulfuromonadaceae bacterium]